MTVRPETPLDIAKKRILSIPVSQPEKLFSSPDNVRVEFRNLAKAWHPDMGGDSEVFAHLTEIHAAAQDKISNSTWRTPGLLERRGSDGTDYRIRFVSEFDFGIGTGYIGKSIVAYVFQKDVKDLRDNAAKTLKGLKFHSDPDKAKVLKTEFAPRLPKILKSFELDDGESVLVFEKPSPAIRLADFLKHQKGSMDPKHVAWIISELLNTCCWMQVEGITHNDLSAESLFIFPKEHMVWIGGGWWYAAKEGQRMARLQSARTVGNLPAKVKSTKMASIETDLNQVRLLARELLGDSTGMKLMTDSSVPKDLRNWLLGSSGLVPTDEFKKWMNVMKGSFGARRYVNLPVSFSDVYKEI